MKKRTVYAILAVLLVAGASYCGVRIYKSTYAPKDVKTEEVSSEDDSFFHLTFLSPFNAV